MGATWCRERIEQAQNSKSPVDRIITRCSNAINAKAIYTKQNQSKPANDIVFKHIRYATSHPVPVHRAPPPRSHRTKAWAAEKIGEWQDVPLHASNVEEPAQKTPVPPPRRRKKRKINSLEVLNSQLDKIYESSQNLRNSNDHSHSQLFFGDTLPASDNSILSDSFKKKNAPKSSGYDGKHKKRAKKIMESKTKFMKKNTFRPLSIANDQSDSASKQDWVPPKMIKNISTVSLPSYHELSKQVAKDTEEDTQIHVGPKRNVSTSSLPGESVLTAVSGVTINRLEAYMRRCKSFGSLKPQQLLEKLQEITNKQDSESSDSWSGLDDWDLGIIEYCDAEASEPPLVPKSRLTSKQCSRLFEVGPPSDQPEAESFPPTPPVLCREASLSDNTFDKPHPTHDWFSTPDIPTTSKINTPPPTPEENRQEREVKADKEDDPHSTLLKILFEYRNNDSDTTEAAPTPPKRKSREESRRRQSYQVGKDSPKLSYLMSRSMSLDTTLDEVKPHLSKNWHNMSFSSSQHSLREALADFLGYDDQPELQRRDTLSGVEINLNSSLFPVIGRQDEDKGAPPIAQGEAEDDRKTPSPPPLPSSPSPGALQLSADLSTA